MSFCGAFLPLPELPLLPFSHWALDVAAQRPILPACHNCFSVQSGPQKSWGCTIVDRSHTHTPWAAAVVCALCLCIFCVIYDPSVIKLSIEGKKKEAHTGVQYSRVAFENCTGISGHRSMQCRPLKFRRGPCKGFKRFGQQYVRLLWECACCTLSLLCMQPGAVLC